MRHLPRHLSFEAYLGGHPADAFLPIVVDWKHSRHTGDFSLSNFLWKRGGGLPPSAHTKEMFDLAGKSMFDQLFGGTPLPETEDQGPA